MWPLYSSDYENMIHNINKFAYALFIPAAELPILEHMAKLKLSGEPSQPPPTQQKKVRRSYVKFNCLNTEITNL